MKKKILLLGSTGMIGHQVFSYLDSSDNYSLTDISYRKKLKQDTILLDIRDDNLLIQTLQEIKPDIVINCIGVLISVCDKDIERAIQINALFPHKLARYSDAINAKLIHMSTDCVFSGQQVEPYQENDHKDGLDNYAKTKGLGEIVHGQHLTLRTSVVGPELKADGEELFNWFMSQKGEINGYTNAMWSGVTTLELAKAVKWSIDYNITGLYHITNGLPISKYDLLELFQQFTKKNISIKPNDDLQVNKSFIDTRKLINYDIPSYSEMISTLVQMIKNNKHLYKQYQI